jgi:hypothetical protein
MYDPNERLDCEDVAHYSDMNRLSQLADELARRKARVLLVEAELREAQKSVKDIEEGTLPAVMDELGVASFQTISGFQIEIEEAIHPSVLVDNRQRFFHWLEEHGHGGLIKRAVTIAFNKEQGEAARALQDELMGRGYPGVKSDESVHPSTLKSWVTHRLEDGEEIPDTIALNPIRIAKITK